MSYIPRVVYDVARKLIRDFGEFDEGKVYVDSDHVYDAIRNHDDVVDVDEWWGWINFVISNAQFEITWPDEFVNGYHESCPYDCDHCHDDDVCTCYNCERIRAACNADDDQESEL